MITAISFSITLSAIKAGQNKVRNLRIFLENDSPLSFAQIAVETSQD
jgi:hypothetical protein